MPHLIRLALFGRIPRLTLLGYNFTRIEHYWAPQVKGLPLGGKLVTEMSEWSHSTVKGGLKVVKAAPWAVPQLALWQCPSSPPVPPQGAPGGSGRLGTPRAEAQATGRPATASGARASRMTLQRTRADSTALRVSVHACRFT